MGKAPSASRADTAVKLVLIFFISLLSFSVGTYVGKQVSESEARQAALEVDYNGDEQSNEATAGEHTTAQSGDQATEEATAPISDEEVSTLTEEFVKAERRQTASTEDTSHATNETTAETTTADHTNTTEHADGAKHSENETGYTHRSKMNAKNNEDATVANAAPKHDAQKPNVSSAANRVAHDLAPAADPKKSPPAPTRLPTVATTAIGKYTVQIASYATEEEAKNHAAKLTTKGYSAFYVPAVISDKTWYRVSVGLFSDQKSATNYRTELLATQAVSSAIVQKIVK